VVDAPTATRLLYTFSQTCLGDAPILVGSSGLFGFATSVPPYTEDVDLALPESFVVREGERIVDELVARGFRHPAGSATFIDPRDGTSFDFLGHGAPSDGDHIGGAGRLRVMVFEDLSRLLADPRATAPLVHGRSLTPAGFIAAKVLTERVHKGSKDKLQALLVLAERADDAACRRDVRGLLGLFDRERRDDARADAQGALLALAGDPSFTDAGAEGYAQRLTAAQRGLGCLFEDLDG
jgi:hypothetical protein